MRTFSPHPAAATLVLLSALTAACNPEAGMAAPKNPGTIAVHVLNDGGSPVPDVPVEVELPNEVGGVFTVSRRTNGSGIAMLHAIPEGTRPVSVTPPGGYSIEAAQRVQRVEVKRNQTVSVTFILTRN